MLNLQSNNQTIKQSNNQTIKQSNNQVAEVSSKHLSKQQLLDTHMRIIVEPIDNYYILLINFWTRKTNISDFFLFKNIKKVNSDVEVYFPNYNKQYPITLHRYDSTNIASLLLREELANEELQNKLLSQKKVKIFYCGECLDWDWPLHVEYRQDRTSEALDLFIDFVPERDIDNPNYYRYPIYLLYEFSITNSLFQVEQILASIERNKLLDLSSRNKIAALITRHDMSYIRAHIYDKLQQFFRIECPSDFMHNSNDLHEKFGDNKQLYLKQFIFNICPENRNSPGYVTEKLFDAVIAGCIPIYNGSLFEVYHKLDPDQQYKVEEAKIFNLSRIIIWDHNNPQPAIDQILRILNDPIYAKEFLAQPIFVEGAAYHIYKMIYRLRSKLESLGLEYY